MIIPDDGRMKPILILPPDTMGEDDVKALRDNGICVVISKDPAAIKFLDPIPSMAQRTRVEDAAISLSRKIMTPGMFKDGYGNPKSFDRSDVCRMYVDILVKGTPLDPEPLRVEVEKRIFDQAKEEEVRKIAREEARAEAAAKKAAKAAAKTK